MGDYYYHAGGRLSPDGSIPDLTPTAPTIPLPTVTHTPPEFEHITDFGHRTLWVLFVLMLISTITFIGLSWRVAIPKRLFFQTTTYVTLISTFTYYALATGGGWSYQHVWVTNEHKHDIPDTHKVVLRQIFWAKFIDWLLTTPLILFNLGALAGLSGSNILNTIVAATAMNFTGLFAVYSHGRKTTWGWYAMAWIAFLTVGWHLVVNARATAQRRGGQLLYNPIALYTVVVWIGYLVIWGVSDISRGISPNETVIAYAVLDILAKPALGFWLVLGHDKSSSTQVNVDGVWTEGFGHREGLLRVGERDGDA
ncbi:hypothetical protein TWF569_004000 [Orbilia oligospora]|uniref:Opsin-1 n=1 Tax=Orbilia oligospora TaxID=2813651 RepID=A0A7C8JCW3_ORBOL|nr:hypothetical protein TWF706_009672 [Orbilia oligospora]KAF3094188.1 hypothetical protein TWF102_007693 [Orbilia oligospora]KAF3111095.1 hypothetical protein TWF103_003782 [Orbilia oligospora]KAF3129955.1 hypothetical protein TWF703_008489 [Orbilia oligospora]KAF3138733.1 hypothetical protein TWF594_006923 [Orbilia oligospora]